MAHLLTQTRFRYDQLGFLRAARKGGVIHQKGADLEQKRIAGIIFFRHFPAMCQRLLISAGAPA